MIYTAAVLKENSRHLLRWLAKALTTLEEDGFRFQTSQAELLPHHMTLNLGAFDDSLNDPSVLGGFAEIHVDRLRFNYTLGVCAAPVLRARVESIDGDGKWLDLKTINDFPHITTCLKPGVSAKTSNEMLSLPRQQNEEVVFDQTYVLEAWVQEVRPQKTYLGA